MEKGSSRRPCSALDSLSCEGIQGRAGARNGTQVLSSRCSDWVPGSLLDEALLDEDAADDAFNHLLERAATLASTLEHVPDDALDALADDVTFDIDRVADLLGRDDGPRLRVRDQHDAKHAAVRIGRVKVGVGGASRGREVSKGERGPVEGDVTFRDHGREELEREGEQHPDRVAVGDLGHDLGRRVDVALDHRVSNETGLACLKGGQSEPSVSSQGGRNPRRRTWTK